MSAALEGSPCGVSMSALVALGEAESRVQRNAELLDPETVDRVVEVSKEKRAQWDTFSVSQKNVLFLRLLASTPEVRLKLGLDYLDSQFYESLEFITEQYNMRDLDDKHYISSAQELFAIARRRLQH